MTSAMFRKTAFLTSFIFIVVSLFSRAHAGPRVGNGDGAWVCQRNDGTYKWVRLVDLFEAENEYGLQPISFMSNDPWALLQERYSFAISNSPELAQLLTLKPAELRPLVSMVPKSTELVRIYDDQIRVKPNPASCKGGVLFYGQIANFTFDGRLLIARDLWDDPNFLELDRAAVLMHELVYKALRDRFNETTSSRARAIVAHLFSNLEGIQMRSEVLKILASQDPVKQEPKLSRPFDLVCVAHIESETSATIPGRIAYLSPAKTSDELSVDLGGFSFRVRKKPSCSFPTELAITDLKTGIRTMMGEKLIRPVFENGGKVMLSLELTATSQIVLLECRAVPLK